MCKIYGKIIIFNICTNYFYVFSNMSNISYLYILNYNALEWFLNNTKYESRSKPFLITNIVMQYNYYFNQILNIKCNLF